MEEKRHFESETFDFGVLTHKKPRKSLFNAEKADLARNPLKYEPAKDIGELEVCRLTFLLKPRISGLK
jgi:hypothetical protein